MLHAAVAMKDPGLAPGSHRATSDVSAWLGNVSTSVLIVFVNKVLMDPHKGYAFVFGEWDMSC